MDEVVTRIEALLVRVEALVERAEVLFAPTMTVEGPFDWDALREDAKGRAKFIPHTSILAPGSVLHVRPAPTAAQQGKPVVEGSYIGSPAVDRAKGRKAKVSRDESPKFVEFYTEAYPRRIARDDAWRAWRKAVPKALEYLIDARVGSLHGGSTDADAEDLLLNRAEQWARYWKAKGKEKEFIPYPASWLNDGTWKDLPEGAGRG